MTDVTEFPIWDDFPLKDRIPAPYVMRRGPSETKRMPDGVAVLLFQDDKSLLHVDLAITVLREVDGKVVKVPNLDKDADLGVMVSALGGAIFERNHPGKFSEMIKAEGICARDGTLVPEEYRVLNEEYTKLTSLVAPAIASPGPGPAV